MIASSLLLPGITEAQCPSILESRAIDLGDSPFNCGYKIAKAVLKSDPNSNTDLMSYKFSVNSDAKIINVTVLNNALQHNWVSGMSDITITVRSGQEFPIIAAGIGSEIAEIEYTLTFGNSAIIQTDLEGLRLAGTNTLCTGTDAAPIAVPFTKASTGGSVLIPSQFFCASGSNNHGLPNRKVTTSWISPTSDLICQTLLTDQNGSYACEVISPCTYMVCVSKDNPTVCGLDEFDITRIRRYILGMECFDYLWQFYAADANSNGIISTADLLVIQLCLLNLNCGIVEPWKYISNTKYAFLSNIINPGSANCFYLDQGTTFLPISNCQSISAAPQGYHEDWYSFPTGDVNHSCTNCLNFTNPITRTKKDQEIIQLSKKSILEIDLQFGIHQDIVVGSFAISFPKGLKVSNFNLQGIDKADYTWNFDKTDNKFRCIIYSPENHNISLSNAILTLNKPITSNELNDIALSSDEKIHNVGIFENDDYIDWNLDKSTFNINELDFYVSDDQRIYTNKFVSSIKLLDLQGKIIWSDHLRSNSYKLPQSLTPGVYLLSIDSDDELITKKMVFIP